MTKRVVILGGGFAGVSTARELVKRLRAQQRLSEPRRRRDEPDAVQVTLVSRDNYFVFQPLLADILSATIETTHVVVPLRRMLGGVDVEVAVVERIDPERRVVEARRRLHGERVEVAYDELVLALGSVTDFRSVPGMAEHAVGIRTLGDAFYLRNRGLDVLEEARLEPDEERRQRLLTVVVVGGGSTGVEVAAEVHDLLRTAARTFVTDRPLVPHVVLVHSGPYLLPQFGERLGRYTTRKLAAVGVELMLGKRLARVGADSVTLDDGSSIPTETVVSTVGNAPHPALAGLPARRDARGWILPDPTFRVPGLDHVWALGDCASIVDPRDGRPMPATAQHAIREGPHAARNVVASLDGGEPEPFSYEQQGMLVSLGRFRGAGEILGVRVSGLLAWIAWRGYYLLRLPTLDRKVRVGVDWTLDWFLRRDVVEINVRRTRTRPDDPGGGEDLEIPVD
ncbi:MAG TPA: NAD(P)/FAD-dependent oxidoreductase [Candidatus Dormibacteraeota bacterium]|nr:NAD(P)/FAD-dependent oxidoreductase [Candidatus Dormibacteraeota bacterium]